MRHHRRHLGPRFSEGSRLLWVAMGTQLPAAFERDLGWRPGMLSNILYGERGVGRKTGKLLLERHAIPLDAWDEEPTVPFTPPAARADDEASETDGAA